MGDIGIPVDGILKKYRYVNNFQLENVLDPDENEEEINASSHLYTMKLKVYRLIWKVKTLQCLKFEYAEYQHQIQSFTIPTGNSKSIKYFFHAICLHETWLKEDANLSLFRIAGYQCILKGKTRS